MLFASKIIISITCLLISSVALCRLPTLWAQRRALAMASGAILIASWLGVFQFGLPHPYGYTAMLIGSFAAGVIILSSRQRHKKDVPPELPQRLMREIEADFIEEYRKWTDTSNGPSLLGTMNDYYRLVEYVIHDFEEEHPEVFKHHRQAVLAKLDALAKTL